RNPRTVTPHAVFAAGATVRRHIDPIVTSSRVEIDGHDRVVVEPSDTEWRIRPGAPAIRRTKYQQSVAALGGKSLRSSDHRSDSPGDGGSRHTDGPWRTRIAGDLAVRGANRTAAGTRLRRWPRRRVWCRALLSAMLISTSPHDPATLAVSVTL